MNQLCLTKVTPNSLATDKPVALGFQIELDELEMLVFDEGGKPEYPEKNLSEQEENQQQTQPTYDWQEAGALTTAPPLLLPLTHLILRRFKPRIKLIMTT